MGVTGLGLPRDCWSPSLPTSVVYPGGALGKHAEENFMIHVTTEEEANGRCIQGQGIPALLSAAGPG